MTSALTGEYISNPRLALLAEELRILNAELIEQKLPDYVRIVRMRDFARTARHISGDALGFSHTFDNLPTGISVTDTGNLKVRVTVLSNGVSRCYSRTCASMDDAIATRDALIAEHRTGENIQ